MRLIVLDTETTGLDPDIHEIWEVGVIVRDINDDGTYEDVEHQWFLPMYNFKNADPFALDIGKFWTRYKWPDAKKYDEMDEWARMFMALTRDAIIVGAVPDFDIQRLNQLCKRHGYRLFNHYHLICIENLIAGKFSVKPPWNSSELSKLVGIDRDTYSKHEALSDARWARDCFDAVMAMEMPNVII